MCSWLLTVLPPGSKQSQQPWAHSASFGRVWCYCLDVSFSLLWAVRNNRTSMQLISGTHALTCPHTANMFLQNEDFHDRVVIPRTCTSLLSASCWRELPHIRYHVGERVVIPRTRRRVLDMSVKGSWYHGPEHLRYQRVVDANSHTSHILHIYASQQHIWTHHWAKTVSGREVYKIAERRKAHELPRKLDISSWAGGFRKGRDDSRDLSYVCYHVGYKGSWYHGPEHLCYQRAVEENYHTLGIMSVNGSLYQDNNRQQDNCLDVSFSVLWAVRNNRTSMQLISGTHALTCPHTANMHVGERVVIPRTRRRVLDMSVKGSWYHGPEHLCYQRVVDENYHTSHIFHIYTSASSWHVG